MFANSLQVRPRALGARNARGNQEQTWPESDWWILRNVGVAPGESVESTDRGHSLEVADVREVYAEFEITGVSAGDRAWFEDREWEFSGRPRVWRDEYQGTIMGTVLKMTSVDDHG